MLVLKDILEMKIINALNVWKIVQNVIQYKIVQNAIQTFIKLHQKFRNVKINALLDIISKEFIILQIFDIEKFII